MFDIVVNPNKQKKELDEFIFKNPYASIFQTSAMAEVYQKNKGAKPLVIAAVDQETGEIIGSLLAKILEEKPGILATFSRHSTIRGGPIFEGDRGVQSLKYIFESYDEVLDKKVLYSRIYPLEYTPQIIPIFNDFGYRYEDWNNYLIDLSRPKNEVWNNLKKSKKNGINRAKKFGLHFREISNRKEVRTFYELVKQRFTLRKNPLEDISNFEAVYDILVPRGMAKFFFVEYEGNCIATTLVLLYKNKIYDWYNGSDSNFLEYNANDLIIWSVLEWGIGHGFQFFDFGGGGLPEEQNEGWVKFKERFGGKKENYGRYTYVHQPMKLKFAETAFKIYKHIL